MHAFSVPLLSLFCVFVTANVQKSITETVLLHKPARTVNCNMRKSYLNAFESPAIKPPSVKLIMNTEIIIIIKELAHGPLHVVNPTVTFSLKTTCGKSDNRIGEVAANGDAQKAEEVPLNKDTPVEQGLCPAYSKK